MKRLLLQRLCCPKSGQPLTTIDLEVTTDSNSTEEIMEGFLVTEDRKYRYPIRDGIPRFVPESNYADSFGMQWNHFAKTQLDSYSGHSISADRFWKATNWEPEQMKNQWVLDVGCGSGRFAEIALNAGAQLVALDYSTAVDACYTNLNHHSNLHVVQGDIYALPFFPQSFGFVYSLGVLQHTPDVATAFASLPPCISGGGHICVDFYEKSLKTYLIPKTWLRPLTKRMDKQQLFSLVESLVPVLLPVSRMIGGIPLMGKLLKRMIPVANYEGIYPLTETQLMEWALLDTFDWLSPTYDNPQTAATIQNWLEKAELSDIQVGKAGHLVARGRKKDKV